MARDDAYRSRKGWFTLVASPFGSGLAVKEVKESDLKTIRALGGTIWDREGYSEDILNRWNETPKPVFVGMKGYRLFVPPDVCACQKTGWKPYDDKE